MCCLLLEVRTMESYFQHAMQSISMRRLGRADRWAPESHSSAPQEDSGGWGGQRMPSTPTSSEEQNNPERVFCFFQVEERIKAAIVNNERLTDRKGGRHQ